MSCPPSYATPRSLCRWNRSWKGHAFSLSVFCKPCILASIVAHTRGIDTSLVMFHSGRAQPIPSYFRQLFGFRSFSLCILRAEKRVHILRQESLARCVHACLSACLRPACLPACNHFALMPVTLCKERAGREAGRRQQEGRGGVQGRGGEAAAPLNACVLSAFTNGRPSFLPAAVQRVAFLQESEGS